MTTLSEETRGLPAPVLLLTTLICASFASNFFLNFSILEFNYFFGSIFVLITLRLFGIRWGIVAGAAAAVAPLVLFGYPFVMPWILAEPFFVGWLLSKKKKHNIVLCDTIYWLILGAPLTWLFFKLFMRMPTEFSTAAVLFYWMTGTANALIADITLTHLPETKNFSPKFQIGPTPIRQLISNLLMTVVLIPPIIFLAIYQKNYNQRITEDIANDLKSSVKNAVYELRINLYKTAAFSKKETETDSDPNNGNLSLDKIPKDDLTNILLRSQKKDFNRLVIVSANGYMIAGSDKKDLIKEQYQPCFGGVQTKVPSSDLFRCAPSAASSRPPWFQNQQISYGISMDVAHGSPWSIVADSSYAPYQALMIKEYAAIPVLALCINSIVLMVSLYISRRLIEPLSTLSRASEDFPNRILDDDNPEIPKSRVAEIDKLCENFKIMAKTLDAKLRSLLHHSEKLKERDRQRVTELTRLNEEMKKENIERKQAEQQRDQLMNELLNQLRLLQKMIDAIPNPIFYWDINNRFLGCNRAFEEDWGLDREEIIGKTANELFSEPALKSLAMSDQTNHGHPEVSTIESQVRYADGKNHEIIIYKATYDDMKGNIAGVVGNIVDITPRKKVETERDQLLMELRQKNKELEGIVYIASHDLRSPLVNIQGFSRKLAKSCAEIETILSGPETTENQKRMALNIIHGNILKSLTFITDGAEKIDMILKGLLRLSRLGRVVLCFDTLDMQMIIGKIISSMTYQLETAGARIDIGRLDPCMADIGQVNQIFSNLLDNAVKYRSPDRPLSIQIFSEEFDEEILYCVEDNGVGIPHDKLDTIWDIFKRLHPEHSQGEGLGLTIVRQITSRLGGNIWVESEENIGSKFYVILPKPKPQ